MTTTYYVGRLYEEEAGGGYTKYYYAGDALVAFTRSAGYGRDYGRRYVFRDHLGGTALILNGQGAKLWEDRYKAFGDVYYTYRKDQGGGRLIDLQTSYRYTGQRFDAGVAASAANGLDRGLYFYKSRYYDPTLGRFIQPDTIVPNPGDPQSLNRYAYVLNNPLRYTDPTGHAVDPGLNGAGAPGCNTGSSIYNCIYPEDHPLAGYPIGTTEADIQQAQAEMQEAGEVLVSIFWEPADWSLTVNRWRKGDFSYWDLAGLLPVAPASGARVFGKKIVRYVDIVPTGQWHHVFSNKIMQSLEEHRTLAGVFRRDDILVRAFDRESHIGYQKWHRAYDDEVVEWLETNRTATPVEFVDFLQEVYSRSDMLHRFPFALNALEALHTQFR